jgi:hypothetical protein
MPNFDTGHYFLTTLAPIKTGAAPSDDEGMEVSYVQRLRMVLATLPTALQSPATEKLGMQSPFARNPRTHFCRFVVIDDVVFNGRVPVDGIRNAIMGTDPVRPRSVDRLSTAYLLFVVDVDAVLEDGAALPEELSASQQDAVRDAYARKLWETAESELRRIYASCVGFDGVADAAGFARYLERCQVETTMPFHDYWTRNPGLPTLPTTRFALIAGIPLAVFALAALGWLTHASRVPVLGWLFDLAPGPTAIVSLGVSLGALFGLYRWALALGARPFPPAAHGDLPSVLKALYLQQRFAEFAAEHQGDDPDELHQAFATFIAVCQPTDKLKPTQPAGVVSSIAAPAVP